MASNNLQSVIARTLLALPFLANGVTTFLLLDPMSNAGPALDAMKPVLDRAQALLGTNVLPEVSVRRGVPGMPGASGPVGSVCVPCQRPCPH